MTLPVNGSTHLIPAYYSFIDPEKMKGWVGLVGWLVADGLPTLVVTSAAGRAQDRESSPVRDRRSTTVPRHQLNSTQPNFTLLYFTLCSGDWRTHRSRDSGSQHGERHRTERNRHSTAVYQEMCRRRTRNTRHRECCLLPISLVIRIKHSVGCVFVCVLEQWLSKKITSDLA